MSVVDNIISFMLASILLTLLIIVFSLKSRVAQKVLLLVMCLLAFVFSILTGNYYYW